MNGSIQRSTRHLDMVHVHVGNHPVLPLHVLSVNSEGQILRHDAVLVDDLDTGSFKVLAPMAEGFVAVEFSTVQKSSSPSKDRGNGVCGCLVALLPLAIMPRHGAYKNEI